ncbi:hypothetical protein HTZ97_14460 [Desulfuromonas acetoxidans]|nr:hypothetical protein [Desulfuromonas acetoxidans]MBF0644950.1 hypothetical protein [Desulfuromonas acetoxidans]NVD25607.1 hypothetical protein [Desulfuromonas acetoxidans]NVE17659.1 hypothetical protein [Desulfuromonas acetoxidans]
MMSESVLSLHLEESLQRSIEQYQMILDLMKQITRAISSSEADLRDEVLKLGTLQQQARDHDAKLLNALRQAGHVAAGHPLFKQRLDLIGEVLTLNHLLLPKINGMMALISHELTGLKKGRSVLGGYKQTTHNQGRIVRSTV